MIDTKLFRLLDLQRELMFLGYNDLSLEHLQPLRDEVDNKLKEYSKENNEQIIHSPRLTADGNPAHGCEICDGDNVCSCSSDPNKGYSTCLGCGGKWPKCDPNYKK